MEKEKLAFEKEDRGYTVKAWYLKEDTGDAFVEIKKGNSIIREFKFPAYKIWNIAAHFSDIVDSEIAKNQQGYEMAAWNGISNSVVILPKNPK